MSIRSRKLSSANPFSQNDLISHAFGLPDKHVQHRQQLGWRERFGEKDLSAGGESVSRERRIALRTHHYDGDVHQTLFRFSFSAPGQVLVCET